jgi:hypothetical protein
MTRRGRVISVGRGMRDLRLPILLLVGACSVLHKPESTAFTPTRNGFSFRAIADAAYPEGSQNGEAWRMRWLAEKLATTGVCPSGFDIVSRRPVLLSTGALGSIYDVYYEGRCRKT